MIFTYLYMGERKQKTVFEAEFDECCDILCVGAGAAGAYAAIAAAREGADVMVIEKDESIGGMPINGKVPTFYYGDEGGSYEAAEARALELDRAFVGGYKHTESRHCALSELFFERGIRFCGGSVIIGVYMEENRIAGACALIKGKLVRISCKMLIDATSDGHVIRMCPVRTYLGRNTDGKTAPFTNRIDFLDDKGFYGYYNDDDGYCNQYEPYEYSEKIVKAHAAKVSFLKKGKGRLLSVAPAAGVREGLRFEGEETLTYRDILMGNTPRRILFYSRSDLDKHGRDLAIDEELYQNWWVISNLSTVTARIPVPMGAVIPKGLKGIATAGRCLSVDSYASSAVRMNRDMFRMGECVGIASALAVAKGCDIMEIDYVKYLDKVRGYNVFDGRMKDDYAFDAPNGSLYRPVRFDLKPEEILSGLKTDSPGEAIWACYISGGAAADTLLSQGEIDLHTAIALGIMGRKEALPVLREAVQNRNTDFFRGCRRSNQYKSAAAICLLGRIGEESDIELLSPIAFDGDERKRAMYFEPSDPLVSASSCAYAYYQHFTHAVMALCKLSVRFGREKEIAEKLRELFSGESRDEIVGFISRGKPESAVAAEISDFMDNALRMI